MVHTNQDDLLERLLLPELRESLKQRDWQFFGELTRVLHAPLLTEVLRDLDDPPAIAACLEHIEPNERAEIFQNFPEELQDQLVDSVPKKLMARIIERMAHDDRVDLVKRMDEDHQAVVMPLVARAEREDILDLARYEEGTAGSIMTSDYAALDAHMRVDDALQQLRRIAPDRETIYYIYVIDLERKLIGFLSLRNLIVARPSQKIHEIMKDRVISVTVDQDTETVATRLADYDLIAIPVVDKEGRLVGIVTHDDVMDVVIEEATRDVHRMGAVDPLEGDYMESPFWEIVRKRIVWLYLLFGAEMIATFVLSAYEDLLKNYTALVLFMPVIIATGGNSGSQTASLITRSIALNTIQFRDIGLVALRELSSGIVLGLCLGFLGFLAVLLRQDTIALAIVLVLALICVTTCGSIVGAMMPLLFKQLNLDPAIASGPFVASLIDVVGIFIYCTIAIRFLI